MTAAFDMVDLVGVLAALIVPVDLAPGVIDKELLSKLVVFSPFDLSFVGNGLNPAALNHVSLFFEEWD